MHVVALWNVASAAVLLMQRTCTHEHGAHTLAFMKCRKLFRLPGSTGPHCFCSTRAPLLCVFSKTLFASMQTLFLSLNLSFYNSERQVVQFLPRYFSWIELRWLNFGFKTPKCNNSRWVWWFSVSSYNPPSGSSLLTCFLLRFACLSFKKHRREGKQNREQ